MNMSVNYQQKDKTLSYAKSGFKGSMNYESYRELIQQLHEKGETTGDIQNENMLHYSKLNEQRMRRLDKTVKLNPELEEIVKQAKTQTWLVITEAWCGDAAQNLPVIKKMADLIDSIELKMILRDDNPGIMNENLTNGGKSIPIVIAFDENNAILWQWGPRPAPVQKMVMDYKNQEGYKKPYSEFSMEVQRWYISDKTQTVQNEFIDLLS
jgi:hypothetical protein